MKNIILLLILLSCYCILQAQVQIKRHNEPTISEKGIFGKTNLEKEVVIPEIDVIKVLKKWNDEKIPKFAEPILVNISPLEQGFWERFDNQSINRIKITAKNANSIAIYFDKLNLSKNAEVYIYNSDGTIVTGPISAKENITSNKLWASNVFLGSSIIIEFKAPTAEEKFNELHIQKILYGVSPKMIFPSKDSLMGPGFGLSSSCNINVVCVSGWEQERRAVAQVVDENGGWCSASLIMNTCSTNKPYILTANHCVFQNGSLINTNNSTFEFLWFSPTCTPTTNTTSTLLFNGATIRARWEQSDFALLELNQVIPQNAKLTFLGWSRSSSPPSNSVGIHHPMGDIMKISLDNNPASIGSVRTFPNTAWRVIWDQGTVEGGSSGSPLFDKISHKVVGQLFSNTQPTNPPCNQQTGGTNYGRFDISWTGGGTNDTRLSNWLDPTNTGAITTNTTNVANLTNPDTYAIKGDETVCGTSNNYFIQNIPAGSTVHWDATPSGMVTVNSPNSPQTTITRNLDGVVTLTATITTACGQITTTSFEIQSGYPMINYAINSYYDCYQINAYYYFSINPGPDDYRFVTAYEWGYRPYNSLNETIVGDPNMPNTTVTIIFPTTGTYEVFVRPKNGCGIGVESSDFVDVVYWCGQGGGGMMMLSVSPNPSSGDTKVSLFEKDKPNIKKVITQIKIIDKMGITKRQYNYAKGAQDPVVNLAGLAPDVYTILAFDGKQWTAAKFIKN
jgi:hypothetical protein